MYLGTYTGIFITMTSLLWRHMYLENSQSVQYFAQQFSFTTRQVLNRIEQVQEANMFERQTLTFHFSASLLNSFIYLSHHTPVRPHENQLLRSLYRSSKQDGTRSFLINNAFSTMSKLFTPNIYCWFRKILVTICISDWMAFARCSLPPPKQRCCLWDAFSSNVVTSNVYKWRHSDVIVIQFTVGAQN